MLKNKNGFAIITVLIVISILTVIVIEFSNYMFIELNMTGNFKEETQAYYIAKSGVNMAIAFLKADDNEYDGLDEDWAKMKDTPVPVGNGMFAHVTITDESGKLNMNYLIKDKENDPNIFDKLKAEEIFSRFLEKKGVEYEEIDGIIDSTIDWLDKDDDTRIEGAEEKYYQSLPKPYRIKNGLLDYVSELKMIKGYNDNIMEKLGGSKDIYGNLSPSILSYITIYSNGLININTTPLEIIESLSDLMSTDDAQDITKYREENPFKSIDEVNSNVLSTQDKWNSIGSKIIIKSNVYSVVSEGVISNQNDTTQNTKRRITAVLKKDPEKENHIEILYWRVE